MTDANRELADLEQTEAEAGAVEESEEEVEAEPAEAESDGDEELSDDDFFSLDDDESEEEAGEDAVSDEEETGSEAGEGGEPEPGPEQAVAPEEKSEDLAYYDQITEAAMARVKEITGAEYDEFDPKHKIILTREATKIANYVDNNRAAQAEAAQIIAGDEKLREHMSDRMQDLTKREYDAMVAAEQRGDYSKTLAFMKKVAQEFKSGDKVKAKITAVNTNAGVVRSVPPKTMGSGTGNTPREKKLQDAFSLKDLGLD